MQLTHDSQKSRPDIRMLQLIDGADDEYHVDGNTRQDLVYDFKAMQDKNNTKQVDWRCLAHYLVRTAVEGRQ